MQLCVSQKQEEEKHTATSLLPLLHVLLVRMDGDSTQQHQNRHPERADVQSTIRVGEPALPESLTQQCDSSESEESDNHDRSQDCCGKERPEPMTVDIGVVVPVHIQHVLEREDGNNTVKRGHNLQMNRAVGPEQSVIAKPGALQKQVTTCSKYRGSSRMEKKRSIIIYSVFDVAQ